MSILPASLVVDVTVRANDNFAPRRGFGIPIFLTSTAIAGEVDATARTKSYASMAEVANDWATTDPFYAAAQAAFSQNPRPRQIKAGFYDATTAVDAAGLQAELNAIRSADANWYWLTVEADLRDGAVIQGAIDWLASEERFGIFVSNDELMKDSADATNVAALNKGQTEHSAVIYSSTPAEYPDMALAAALATYDLDQAGTSYTAAFKRLRGVTVENIATDEFYAITGLTPHVGTTVEDGHVANAYVSIGGVQQVQPGTTLTPDIFIDEIHFRHWLISRCREEILNVFANNPKVPFTDQGMAMLEGAVKVVMDQARRNGGLAQDIDTETGDYAPALVIDTPSVFDVPESQRKSRIAPAIAVTFRYSGAVHAVSVNFHVTF